MTPEEFAPHLLTLRRRRRDARPRFAYLLRPGDVIHAPIGPLEVLAPPVPDDDARTELLVIAVRWWFDTGEPYEGSLRHPPMRELAVSRG